MEENDKTNPNSARKLAIVLRDLSQQELQLLVTETAGASLDIQLPDGILPEGLNANPVRVLDVDKIYQESYEDAFEDVLGFGELQLKNGNTLAAQLKGIDGRSWWYYLRFMALYKYRSKLNDHRLLEQINQLKKEYADVLVFHQSGYMHTQMQGTVQSFVKRNADKSALITNTFRFIFIFLFRVLMGITQVGQLFRSARHVLLTNAQPNQTIIRKADLSEIRGDHFAEYLQDAIEQESDFLNLSELFPPNLKANKKIQIGGEILFSRHKRTLNLELILLLQFFNPWFYARALRGVLKVRQSFSGLGALEPNIENGFILQILPSFKRLCFFLAVRKAALTWLFRVKNFETVGGTNEHDPRVKSILETAEFHGKRSFGIQHGVIHPRHMHYCFTPKDATHKPFPDTTFMWGQHWADCLTTDSSYASEQLKVVGQIRSDIIPRLLGIDKSKLIASVDTSKKTILYPSQPLYTGEEEMRKRLATDVLTISKKFPNIQLIIKPHPKELDCADFMGAIAKQVGTTNYQIFTGDLYKSIAASDLVIVYNSTVGAESVYFGKPLLVLDYSGNDFSGFIKSGIGTEVLNYASLEQKVNEFSKDSLQTDADSQHRFVQARAFQIDGQVAPRIMAELRG